MKARALLALLAVCWPLALQAQAVSLSSPAHEVLVNTRGGLPGRWLACASGCSTPAAAVFVALRAGEGGNRLHWQVPGDEAASRALDALAYRAEVIEVAGSRSVLLTSMVPWAGQHLVHRYALAADGTVLNASLQVPPGARLVLTTGGDIRPAPLPGLGRLYSRVHAVRIDGEGQQRLVDDDGQGEVTAAAGQWFGVRNRFHALLLRADVPLAIEAGSAAVDQPRLAFGPVTTTAGTVLALEMHAGIIERQALRRVAPELGQMLYAALWTPLRWLSLALGVLLDAWIRLVGNPGAAIVLLSLSVKVLMAPLTALAERWQDQVNRQQSLLKPELDAIRREFRGEEAHHRVLAAYARHGISPYYTVKSLGGFLVQVPVFIAAFDMLGEHYPLAGAAFAGIADLSLPDRALALPLTVPFFGGHLNVLPCLMTALTVLAARLQQDATLSADLQRGQRLRLYAMAGLFFVLLYTFPAGMVLYWTSNNLFHVVKVVALRARA